MTDDYNLTPDSTIAITNDDATSCKLSAVQLGYYQDEFVQFFVRQPTRRPPIINRGYYTRVVAIRKLIRQFIERGGKQILSLGAGYDTTYWVLKSHNVTVEKYFEIDMQWVVCTKASLIRKHQKLKNLLGDNPTFLPSGEIKATNYVLIFADLRNLNVVENKLLNFGFDPSKPVLILSECVLVYLDTTSSSALIRWFATKCEQAMFLLYEQIKPYTPFGQQMIKNLMDRGVPLLSIKDYPDLESQRQRFLSAGWERVEAKDMNQIYTDFLDLQENKRIEKLEIFDELEEWHLIQSHYCLVAAFIDRKKSGLFDTITLTQYTPQQSHTLLSMQQHTSQNMNTSSSKTENSTTLQTPSHN